VSGWNPGQYLKFESERGKPVVDLLGRVGLPCPARVIDIGCGPGNSTEFLAKHWPQAEIIGLDSSGAMLEAAAKRLPGLRWVEHDASGDLSHLGKFDLVFSNAALQWMPDHERLVPGLFELLNAGGVLAVQVPHTNASPLHRFLEQPMQLIEPGRYYDILSQLTDSFDLWVTTYFHVMDSHKDVMKWYRGKPNFKELPASVPELIRDLYVPQSDGKILFEFKRLFFVAKR